MENINRHERYRENLADDLKEIKSEDKILAKKILEEERQSTRYKEAAQEQLKKRQKLYREIEEKLSENFLNDENFEKGIVDVGVDRIQYDFEIEKETRYVIEPHEIERHDWVNHVIDTYDESGRARVRVKNGSPRLSLKVPLFSKDTETSKACLRLEFKPVNKEQEDDLLKVRELILEEEGAQTSEKWGAPIIMGDGKKAWINRDSDGKWWIEVDEVSDFNPPEYIKVLNTEKSSVKTSK